MHDKMLNEWIEIFIKNKIGSITHLQNVDSGMNFMDYGLSSNDLMNLASSIEGELEIELFPTVFFEYSNIKQLTQYLLSEHTSPITRLYEKSNNGISISPIKSRKEYKSDTTINDEDIFIEEDFLNSKELKEEILKDSDNNDVAIIGISGIFPKGLDVFTLWNALECQIDVISEIPIDHFDYKPWFDETVQAPDKMYCKWGGFIEQVDKFDANFFNISPREAETMDPQLRLLLQVLYSTIEDAGYTSRIRGTNTGMFVGACSHDYQQEMDRCRKSVASHDGTGNVPTMLANRPSFYFNLRGPSIAVDTACSSSLVALHLACNAIKNDECDMAFVAGVNLLLTSWHYRYFCSIGALSPTGRCHTFSDKADGYVPGEAIVSILIKPLTKAIQAGDRIHAVIKGSAVKHGGYTPSITAPSTMLEAETLLAAWKNARIDPATMTYVETHGTGTKLGDPVEINALKQAFKQYTDRENFCALGSSKSNFGHAEGAAGLVGIVKTIVSLNAGMIPAMPSSGNINPYIELDKSPFYINEKTIPWETHGNKLRRAGVSSFGFGGTYAHVVLEEYRAHQQIDSKEENKPYLCIFSAKTLESLREYVKNFINFINSLQPREKYPHFNLRNIAYTLQMGREALNYRLAIIAKSIEELNEKLSHSYPNKTVYQGVYQGNISSSDTIIAKNLITGRGGEAFTRVVIEDGEIEKLAELWSIGIEIDWKLIHGNNSGQLISLPNYAFIGENFWFTERRSLIPNDPETDRKIDITGLHGYYPLLNLEKSSPEEGSFHKIFTNDDLIIKEHSMHGKMVLPGTASIEIALTSAYMLLSKAPSAIENMIWSRPIYLEDGSCECTLQFHNFSNIHAPINFTYHTKSNVCYAQGRLVYDVENSGYSLHKKLDISDILNRCLTRVNKEKIYTRIAKLGLQLGRSFQVIDEIFHNETELLAKLSLPEHLIAQENIYKINPYLLDGALQSGIWLLQAETLYIPYELKYLRIYKPLRNDVYVYASLNIAEIGDTPIKKLDIKILDHEGNVLVELSDLVVGPSVTSTSNKELVVKNRSDDRLFYFYPEYVEESINNLAHSTFNDVILVFDTDARLANALRSRMLNLATNGKVIFIEAGESYKELIKNEHYMINRDMQSDYIKLIKHLNSSQLTPNKIVNFCYRNNISNTEESLLSHSKQTFCHLLFFLQAFLNQYRQNKLDILYGFFNGVEHVQPIYEGLFGIAKTLYMEHPQCTLKIIEWNDDTNSENQYHYSIHDVIDIIASEFSVQDSSFVRYRNAIRSVRRYKQKQESIKDDKSIFNRKGVYIITGGLGGIGKLIADHLTKNFCADIVLVGRSPLSEENYKWMAMMKTMDSKMDYVQTDISSKLGVDTLLKEIRQKYKLINGVIHCAGVQSDTALINKDVQQVDELFRTKIMGLWHLDRAFSEEPLDFFLVFSSIAGVLGNIGQVDYAYANAWMDSFMQYREQLMLQHKRYGRSLSIAWPLWQEGGMKINQHAQKLYQDVLGLDAISTKEAFEALYHCFSLPWSFQMVLKGDYQRLIKHVSMANASNIKDAQPHSIDRSNNLINTVKLKLARLAAVILKSNIQKISLSANMSEYGFDSITLMEFSNAINNKFNLSILPSIFFSHPTIEMLANYLTKEYHQQLSSLKQEGSEAKVCTESFYPDSDHNELSVNSLKVGNFIKEKVYEEVAVIGMSGVFPQSDNIDELWHNLIDEKDLITEIPKSRWDWQAIYGDPHESDNQTYVKWGGFIHDVDKFDAGFFNISPREAELMDPQQRIFMQVVWHAIEDAGYKTSDLRGSNTALYVGAAATDYNDILLRNNTQLVGMFATGTAHSIIANRISYLLDIHGPSESIDTACSSSLIAIHRALEAIWHGKCEMAIAGGVNVMLNSKLHIAFSKAGMLSSDGKCKTLDSLANGYVRGEGAGALLLKPVSKALRDGDHIYAVICGSAVNHGGRAQSLTAPNPSAQASLLVDAYKQAAFDIDTVSYLELHGTGTTLGDQVEFDGLQQAFAKLYEEQKISNMQHNYCGIGSIKTNIGHLEPAAGIASIIKVILSLSHKQLPGSLHVKSINPYIKLTHSPFYIVSKTKFWEPLYDRNNEAIPRRAGVSSFGFGGSNAHVVLQEYHYGNEKFDDVDVKPQLFILSAKDTKILGQYAEILRDYLVKNQKNRLSDVAYTLQIGRDAMSERLAIVADTYERLINKLESYCKNEIEETILVGSAEREAFSISSEGFSNLSADNLKKIGKMWVNGADVDWKLLRYDSQLKRVSLPTYPFKKESHWIDINEEDIIDSAKSKDSFKNDRNIYSGSISLEAENFFHAYGPEILERKIYAIGQDILTKIFVKVSKLSFDRIQPKLSFEKYGINSLMILEINNELSKCFGDVKKTLLFEYKNLSDLTQYVVENYRDVLLLHMQSTDLAVDKNKILMIEAPVNITPKEHKQNIDTDNMDIAIIGIDGRYPQARTLYDFWINLKNGVDSIEEIPEHRWSYKEFYNPDSNQKSSSYTKWGSFIDAVDEFDALFFNISPREAELMDPQERLFLECAWKTIENAGYAKEQLGGKDIGVFIGVIAIAQYQLFGAEKFRYGGMVAPNNSFASIANRISYFFDFHGPSISVDTMCSSSLTAIHMACQSIRMGECSAAIAGGVNLSIHPDKYLLLSQGKFMSTDGRCRSFGINGDGYVPGEGIGAVLLKPLASALADGDHIYGVIKASAINHGGKTHGYTVPNPNEQARLIDTVFKKSNINPEHVSYIEAHGTGTSLGDPIEVAALTKAFASNNGLLSKKMCAIGSVKSNIGHLEAAAGIAGLTKIILQMQHKQLVPSLHSDVLNPNIDFGNLFYVQRNLQQWDPDPSHGIRMAGLSSFGAGGANAHLIVEEFSNQEAITPIVDKPLLFVLSARTHDDLKRYAKLYIDCIHKDLFAKIAPEDLVFTLQTGREHMRFRLAIEFKSMRELALILEEYIAGSTQNENILVNDINQHTIADNDGLVNEFPAPDSLRSIAQLWTRDKEVNWLTLYDSRKPKRVPLPSYPFQGKKYWIKENKTMDALLHPLVHSIKDALPDEFKFSTQFSGDEFFLVDHQVLNNKVLPGVAYLEMAIFAAKHLGLNHINCLKNIVWLNPIIISSKPYHVDIEVKGKLNDAQYKIMSYDANKAPILHAQGMLTHTAIELTDHTIDIKSLQNSANKILSKMECYEIFEKHQIVYGESFQVIEKFYCTDHYAVAHLVLPKHVDKTIDSFQLYPALADGMFQTVMGMMITKSEKLDSNKVYLPFTVKEINLLGRLLDECYVYVELINKPESTDAIQAFSIKVIDQKNNLLLAIKNFEVKQYVSTNEQAAYSSKKPIDLYYFNYYWKPKENLSEKNLSEKIKTLIVFNNKPLAQSLEEKLNISVMHADILYPWESNHSSEFTIRLQYESEYIEFFKKISLKSPEPLHIIYCTKSFPNGYPLSYDEFVSLFHLTRALIQNYPKEIVKLIYAYDDSSDAIQLVNASMSGFFKTIKIEHPRYSYKLVQCNSTVHFNDRLNYYVDELQKNSFEDIEVRYTDNQREVKLLREYVDSSTKSSETSLLKDHGVYIITGGMGGLGKIIVRFLVSIKTIKVIIVGRSALSIESQKFLDELNTTGSEVAYIQADICQREHVQSLINRVQAKYARIDGIIHAAGALRDAVINKKSLADLKHVIEPKLLGTMYLDECTADLELSFFLCFSSISAVMGNSGQSDYAYANTFMDNFAAYRDSLCQQKQRFGKSVSINWPLWAEGGMQIDEQTKTLFEKTLGLSVINKDEGLHALVVALNQNSPQVMVVKGDKTKIDKLFLEQKISKSEQPIENKDNHILLSNKVQQETLMLVSRILKLDIVDIDVQSDISDFGFDSVTFTELANALNETYDLSIMPSIFFEHPSIASLCDRLCKDYSDQLVKFYQDDFSKNIETVQSAVSDIQLSQDVRPAIQDNSRSQNDLDMYSSSSTSEKKDGVAVIGMSGRFPESMDLNEYWNNLINGKDLITEVQQDRWDWKNIYEDAQEKQDESFLKWGGFIQDIDKFDASFFSISPKEADLIDPQHRICLETVWKAIEDAGYNPRALSGTNTGLFIGVASLDYHNLLHQDKLSTNPHAATGLFHSVLTNRISYLLDLHGPSEPIDTACSSSLVAIYRAAQAIQNGECEVCIAGGVNALLSPELAIAFSKAGMLSPDGRCKTFSSSANGYVRGEGVGIVVLKSLNKAIEDGDHIYGVIRGAGINHGGKSSSLTAPNTNAQKDLLVNTYQKAAIDFSTITYIEAHGTGTSLGDPIEINALKSASDALGDKRKIYSHEKCGIGSVKTNIGHLETAAGIAGFIKILLAMKYKMLPKTIHLDSVNPYINLMDTSFFFVEQSMPWKCLEDSDGKRIPRRAGISSFGFGGVNAHVILEEYMQKKTENLEKDQTQRIFVLSARDAKTLKIYAENSYRFLNDSLEQSLSINLDSLVYTLQVGRPSFAERLAIVFSNLEDLQFKLNTFISSDVEIEQVYHGVVDKKFKNSLELLFNSNMLAQQSMDNLFKNHQFDRIAKLWCSGMEVHWGDLYPSIKPSKMPLPTYPFLREKHWYKKNNARFRSGVDKPLKSSNELELFNKALELLQPYCAWRLFEKLHNTIQFSGSLSYSRADLARHLSLLPKYNKLFDAMLAILSDANVIALDGQGLIRLSTSIDTAAILDKFEDMNKEREALLLLSPRIEPYLKFFDACISNIVEIIQGKLLATDIIFPGSSMDLVERMYSDNPSADYYNSILSNFVADKVRQYQASKTSEKKFNILEVGAGTGGATRYLLPKLSKYSDVINYHYTDVSVSFLNYGRRKFSSEYQFMNFNILNIAENTMSMKGNAVDEYDLIIAANVLHATPDLKLVLKNAVTLLKSDGCLVINELTAVNPFLTLTFGLLDGWWLFQDEHFRLKHGPLLSTGMWEEMLAAAGFSRIENLCGDNNTDNITSQNIIVAKEIKNTREKEIASAIKLEPVKENPKSVMVDTNMIGQLANIVGTVLQLDVSHIDHDLAFVDLGVDSILAVELIKLINQNLQINLATSDLFSYPNIALLAKYIDGNITSAKRNVVEQSYHLDLQDNISSNGNGVNEIDKILDILKRVKDDRLDILEAEKLIEDHS